MGLMADVARWARWCLSPDELVEEPDGTPVLVRRTVRIMFQMAALARRAR